MIYFSSVLGVLSVNFPHIFAPHITGDCVYTHILFDDKCLIYRHLTYLGLFISTQWVGWTERGPSVSPYFRICFFVNYMVYFIQRTKTLLGNRVIPPAYRGRDFLFRNQCYVTMAILSTFLLQKTPNNITISPQKEDI